MAKKNLFVLLLFFIIGSSSIHAWEYPEFQGLLIGGGVAFVILPPLTNSITDSESGGTTDAICYSVGGILIAGGLIWMIIDIVTSSDSGGGDWTDVEDFSSRKRFNPIIEHFSLGILPNKVFIGANFKF